ncbi:acyltransferase family protein [Glutamicibacter halophytocola]|uniref:acyltransferase family protein n=1 Tax=Glutamicibacter halophytocola TaxID=1933880 RepID=UPI003219935D
MDALRITAALIVVFYHYTAWGHDHWGTKAPEFWPVLSEFTRYGQLGVRLFFLISGFVILMSLQGKNVIGFIGSRVGRLYPAYWLAVIAADSAVIENLASGQRRANRQRYPAKPDDDAVGLQHPGPRWRLLDAVG